MGLMLSKSELSQTEPAEQAAFHSPVPTQIISNGEFNPLPQTAQQRRFEERVKEIADAIAPRLGLDRRQFLRTGCGMAAAFLAMNDVFGRLFMIDRRGGGAGGGSGTEPCLSPHRIWKAPPCHGARRKRSFRRRDQAASTRWS